MSRARNQLTAAVIDAEWWARRDEAFTAHVVAETLACLPSREAAEWEGKRKVTKRIKEEVKARIRKKILAGSIVIGFFITVFWQIIAGVVAALIVAWLLDDRSRGRLIEEAKRG